jgi:hypothetical protein
VSVPWGDFERELTKVHPFCSPEEAFAVRKTMNITDSGCVSSFEFDIFTRLFQPWPSMLNTFNVIVVAHPGYQAYMTYDEVEAILQKWKQKPGRCVCVCVCVCVCACAPGLPVSMVGTHSCISAYQQCRVLSWLCSRA